MKTEKKTNSNKIIKKKTTKRGRKVSKKNIPETPVPKQVKYKTAGLPNHAQIYFAYLFWLTIPPDLKKLPEPNLEEFGFDLSLVPIFRIKTKEEFAKYMGIARNTLLAWEHKDRFKDDIKITFNSNVVERYKAKIDESFSKKTIKYGDAARVKLWHELYYSKSNADNENTSSSGTGVLRLKNEIPLSDKLIETVSIAIVCAKRNLDYGKIIYELYNGYYKELDEAFERGETIEDFKFPSEIIYDFDSIEKEAEARAKETIKNKTRPPKKSLRDILGEELSKNENNQKVYEEEKPKTKRKVVLKRKKEE